MTSNSPKNTDRADRARKGACSKSACWLSRKMAAVVLLALVSLASAQTGGRAAGSAGTAGNSAVLFQVSTLDALLQGDYTGSLSVGQLKRLGDFGLGTYLGLDGEMIALGGHYYHMRSNGVLSESSDDEIVPFAAVTQFQHGTEFTVNQVSMADLSTLLDTTLPSKNYFYAIRIHGTFSSVTTRAIPQQFVPYPPLSQLIPIQSMFTYSNIAGTAVDIRSPAFVTGISQVAHHYHFVSDDLKGGGHALSFTTGQVTISVQALRQFDLWLPGDEMFQNATLPYQQ
jgi:acetolactate decarboxylase